MEKYFFPLYFPLLFVGWWLPALVYYVLGLYWLTTARRKPQRAAIWAATFLLMFAYTAYDGIYLKWRLAQRAQVYRNFVTFAALPADVTTIMVSRSQETDTLTDYAQGCSVVCVKLLFGGRFKTVVVARKNGLIFVDNKAVRERAIAQGTGTQSYDVYTVIDEPGCENYKSPTLYEVVEAWRLIGRCLHKHTVATFTGRYLEVTTNEDTPGRPPWKLRFTTHARLIDGGKATDLARAEYASVNLAFWLPVPGLFPHGASSGLPTDFWPDVLRFEHHYGPFKSAVSVVEDVAGVSLAGPVPLPRLADQSAADQLKYTRYTLFRSSRLARLRFIANELAGKRPLDKSYRDLILDFVSHTPLTPPHYTYNVYAEAIPYIAWLAAGDAGLAPEIVKKYVALAGEARNGASYARALSYFGPDLLAPYADRLLELYARKYQKAEDTERFRESLNFGIGGGGPKAVDKLITELDTQSKDDRAAAAAAAALCRSGDPRAVEPLLKKLRTFTKSNFSMSYLYALARLGHGHEAQEIGGQLLWAKSPAATCLNEIVSRYPSGGAPDSICLMSGPNEQPKDAAWQYSESELHCLAPRTPTPNG
jgi:hypothetical protein